MGEIAARLVPHPGHPPGAEGALDGGDVAADQVHVLGQLPPIRQVGQPRRGVAPGVHCHDHQGGPAVGPAHRVARRAHGEGADRLAVAVAEGDHDRAAAEPVEAQRIAVLVHQAERGERIVHPPGRDLLGQVRRRADAERLAPHLGDQPRGGAEPGHHRERGAGERHPADPPGRGGPQPFPQRAAPDHGEHAHHPHRLAQEQDPAARVRQPARRRAEAGFAGAGQPLRRGAGERPERERPPRRGDDEDDRQGAQCERAPAGHRLSRSSRQTTAPSS